MEEELKRALIEMGFKADEIQLEATRTGNVGGFLVSPKFVGQTQVERQEALWDGLKKRIEADRLARIVSILTMTPDEMDDDVRVAHG